METQKLQVEKSVLVKKSTTGRVVTPASKINDKAIMPVWRGHGSRRTDQWSGIKSAARHLRFLTKLLEHVLEKRHPL